MTLQAQCLGEMPVALRCPGLCGFSLILNTQFPPSFLLSMVLHIVLYLGIMIRNLGHTCQEDSEETSGNEYFISALTCCGLWGCAAILCLSAFNLIGPILFGRQEHRISVQIAYKHKAL